MEWLIVNVIMAESGRMAANGDGHLTTMLPGRLAALSVCTRTLAAEAASNIECDGSFETF